MLNILRNALIVFGVAHAVVDTHGPFDVFKRFKQALGVEYIPEYDEHGNMVDEHVESTTQVGALFTCFYCLSFWLSLLTSRKLSESLTTYGLASFIYRLRS